LILDRIERDAVVYGVVRVFLKLILDRIERAAA